MFPLSGPAQNMRHPSEIRNDTGWG